MGATVVDYAAWRAGYIPPAEHVLIDELAYRGAKVLLASHDSQRGYWIVTKGDVDLRGRRGLLIMKQIELCLGDDATDDVHPLAAAVDYTPAEPERRT